MNNANIYHVTHAMQDAREGVSPMIGYALTNRIHKIIREYGTYHPVDGYSVNLNDLDLSDKKILLSHILDSGEYEFALSSPTIFNAVFQEYSPVIQKLVDERCEEVWHEDNWERQYND